MRTAGRSAEHGSGLVRKYEAAHQVDTNRPPASHPGIAEEVRLNMERPLIMIERRSFVRNCILASLAKATGLGGIGVSSVEEYLAVAPKSGPEIVLISAINANAPELIADILKLKSSPRPPPVVVMSDSDEVEVVVASMENGANGFIAADISLEIAAHALRLVAAGGQYFPVNALLAARRAIDETQRLEANPKSMFTRRQKAVIDALRTGKANKIIAFELNMCESTVKVHIRNIMKKLNAKNRTEVAYLANELLRTSYSSI
jgi:DNA-binding NarL/FixJ family response regulator